jgi:hypothetical protein
MRFSVAIQLAHRDGQSPSVSEVLEIDHDIWPLLIAHLCQTPGADERQVAGELKD